VVSVLFVQFHFNECIFRMELDVYRAEEIPYENITYKVGKGDLTQMISHIVRVDRGSSKDRIV
jgi:myosin heavy subunit